MFRSLFTKSDIVGPHVIVPTDEVTRLRYNGKRMGKRRIWECKYCGVNGIHPDEAKVNITWKKDCEEFEITEYEKDLL